MTAERASAIASRVAYLVGPSALTWHDVFPIVMNPLNLGPVFPAERADAIARDLATLAYLHLEYGRAA
jgi:hypothetical protein